MIANDDAGAVDYRETGEGPTVVFAPGSCSTGAAWRPVIAQLGEVRAITTSLSGYGETGERRTDADHSIAPVAEALEAVVTRAGEAVHLVGHSFGGLASLAVALRQRVPLLSLTILEAPAPGALIGSGEAGHLTAFRQMTDAYSVQYRAGQRDAIGAMIDFYGGAGSWAAMPDAVRAYAVATTPVNLIDWKSAYAFELGDTLGSLAGLPTCVAVGAHSHVAVVRTNQLIAERVPGATFAVIPGAAHFMIATHSTAVAKLLEAQFREPALRTDNQAI